MMSGVRVRVLTAKEDFMAPVCQDGKNEPVRRFHPHIGENIVLNNEGNVALRRNSFAKGIVFSERGLEEREIFLVEITEVENGWSGHLRLGLTHIDPNEAPDLPIYALPGLNRSGRAWVYGITERESITYDGMNGSVSWPERARNYVALVSSSETGEERSLQWVFNPRNKGRNRLPTDVGSRIGIFYRNIENVPGRGQIFLILNGLLLGPLADIPVIPGKPLYAIADVYGTTKEVKIVPLSNQVESLQNLCRSSILGSMKSQNFDDLPLPIPIRQSLSR